MVHADADDRRRARAAGATAVLCPRSNLHIGGRLPDVPALRADGVGLALGTDSLASAPDLSLWGEIAALAEAFPDVAPDVWLAAATSGGAAALRLPALGAIAPGRRPGLLDVATGEARPTLAALVRSPRPQVRWLARWIPLP
jgi:cytosine/adenosine deaminase-related metal-dependent hydrolase